MKGDNQQMSGKSPTQRSLEKLRSEGYLCQIVERWNPHARIRQDLFGIGDILAIKAGETLLVQTTSRGNVAARVTKIQESEHLPTILAAGWKITVHGWGKLKAGWTCKIVDF